MKTIETSKGKFEIYEESELTFKDKQGVLYVYHFNKLVDWNYRINLSEITEEQASLIVDSVTRNSYAEEIGFKNYPFEAHPFNYPILSTALESLKSLLKHHNIEITPNTYIFKV